MKLPTVKTHDNTMMSDFNKCPRWYYIRHELGLRPKGKSAALAFGGAIHDGLAMWYKTKSLEQVLDTVASIRYPNIPGDYRTLGLVLSVLKDYIEYYGEDKRWNVILNETSFDISDPDGFRFGGRLDLGVMWNRRPWVVDHKSTSMGGPSWWREFEVAPQMAGYTWAGSQLKGEPITGVIINRIVVTRTSKISFERRPFRFPAWKQEEWRAARIRNYHQILECQQTGEWPMNRYSCVGRYGKCPAFDVCNSPPSGRATILDFDFIEDRWDWNEE